MSDDLFAWAPPDCDHLPVWERKFIDGWLVCGKCGKRLRLKNMEEEV